MNSIFLDFNLPNAATWFYFSLLLTLAVYFRFNRLLSLWNWDILTIFLLVPGLLLLQRGHQTVEQGRLGGSERLLEEGRSLTEFGYWWLLGGSLYLLLRCLFDLSLIRKPAVTLNLNFAGLAWLALALFVCIGAAAIRRPPDTPPDRVGRGPIALDRAERLAAAVGEPANSTPEARMDLVFWINRTLALVCHAAVLTALILIGRVHFEDTMTGMGAAALYLLLPYTAIHAAQVHHVWPSALLLWGLFAYRRPVVSGVLLGTAAGTAFFPVLLFPLWWSFHRGRSGLRFSIGFLIGLASSLVITAAVLAYYGELAEQIRIALSLSDWQPWKSPETESLWTGVHWAYRLPIFILFAAFVMLTGFWPEPKDLAQVIALSAAVLIGIQFWYADQGGVYVLWYLPLILLLIFRPNLTDRRPPILTPETDRLRQWRQACTAWVRRRFPRRSRPIDSEPVKAS